MFGIFKKKKGINLKSIESEQANTNGFEDPKWYEIGEENPFDERILDIRSIALHVVATTREKWIAENFTQTRSDNGERFSGQNIDDCIECECDIRYPHNGELLEGIVSKAESMDVKWDSYAYGEWFYFVRSWTSDLIYKVHYQNTGSELVFDKIITSASGSVELHKQNIHSMVLTHVLGRVWPYTIPDELTDASEKDIALYMFSQFGNKATIVTKANIFKIKLVAR